MLINSVNNITANSTPLKPQSFKRTAVPYPEYNYAYNKGFSNENLFDVIANKLNDIFHPAVSNQAKDIKKQINTIFDEGKTTGRAVNTLA